MRRLTWKPNLWTWSLQKELKITNRKTLWKRIYTTMCQMQWCGFFFTQFTMATQKERYFLQSHDIDQILFRFTRTQLYYNFCHKTTQFSFLAFFLYSFQYSKMFMRLKYEVRMRFMKFNIIFWVVVSTSVL